MNEDIDRLIDLKAEIGSMIEQIGNHEYRLLLELRYLYFQDWRQIAAGLHYSVRCSHPGCPELTDGQYCDEHKRQASSFYNRYQRDPESRKHYGREWEKIRKRQLRKQPLCEVCSRLGRVTSADQVHHIKPLSKGGTHEPSNLMSICAPCHSGITAREGGRWG